MNIAMLATDSSSNLVLSQLEKVLASGGFVSNDRLTGFLRFVVEQELAGKGDQIKESVIGVEVFGRRPDYDVRQDSVVRTEAGKLRARLAQYYAVEGVADPLVIELPKGGYTPAFRSVEPVEPVLEQPPSRSRRHWLVVGLVCAGLALAGAVWWQYHPLASPITIAVLPLENLSQDPANDYFADGLTDEIIRNVSIIDGLAVRSRTSSFVFKDKPRNVRDAGNQLGADYILEGSVLRSGQQLRINVQLIRVRDDFPLWSGKFDRELTDIFAIQDEISRGIVNSLRLKLGRGRRRYEIDAEVYDLYLKARVATVERGLSGFNRSIGQLEEVIARDPSFAPAYADLAGGYVARSGEFAFNIPNEIAKMRLAAEKAIQLDPLLPQAHYAQGMSSARDSKWAQAEASFRRSLQLDPNRSESHTDFAMFLLLPLGRIDEAMAEVKTAQKADPLSSVVQQTLAYILIARGRYEEAAQVCGKLTPEANRGIQCTARARLAQGRVNEAVQILESEFYRRVPGMGSQIRGELGHAYGRAGRRADAEKLAVETTSINPFNRALIFAGLGDKDRTFAELDRAAAAGPFRIGRALTFPEFALLRGDPRVGVLRKKVGLPE